MRDVLEDRAEGEEAGSRLATGLTIAWSGSPDTLAARHALVRAALLD